MLVSWVIFETHSNLKHLFFLDPVRVLESVGRHCGCHLHLAFCEKSCRRHGWNLHWEWRCWWRRQRILASRASMRRLGGHDPVQRIQFRLWVIWNLCFIKNDLSQVIQDYSCLLVIHHFTDPSGLCDFALWDVVGTSTERCRNST